MEQSLHLISHSYAFWLPRMGVVGDHLQLWTCAVEENAYLEHNLSFLLANLAWMNREVVSGGLFEASCNAS
jgi:hypothetical protein